MRHSVFPERVHALRCRAWGCDMVHRPPKPTGSKPLRVLHVTIADESWKPPKAFKYDQLTFDAEPADHHLLTLLGSGYCGTIAVDERDGVLIVRPQSIPMQFVVPWLLFVACAITSLPWVVPQFGGRIDKTIWAGIALIWFGVLPMMLGLLHFLNQHAAVHGDYFRADSSRGVLDLAHLGVVVDAKDIAYFTDVHRWSHSSGRWRHDRMIGVIVRRDAGTFDLLPVIPNDYEFFIEPIVERLAAMFRKDVRRVSRNFRESKAVGDDR